MSFSYNTKSELCRLPPSKYCCALAEAYGILLYCNAFSPKEIRIITANLDLFNRIPPLFLKAFGFVFSHNNIFPNASKRIFLIDDPASTSLILDHFGFDPSKGLALHVNFAVLEDDCCKASFIKGAFLAGGSVTDPSKRYHLELVTSHFHVDKETLSIFLDLGFLPKSASRNGNFVTYFKQSESIEDILTTMGAPQAAMRVMNAKVEKDMRNSVNRRVNCDTANLEKLINAALEQLDAINRLISSGIFESLSDKLKSTAYLRLNNPEASLGELAALAHPPVSKSCLSHRLRKIVQLSNNLPAS